MSEVITRNDADGSSESPDVRWAPAEEAPRRRHLGLKIGIPVAVVAAGAVAASLVLIAPGTAVAGVPVGFQTAGMAADSISSQLSSISVSLGEGGPTVSAADLGASVDAASLADAAFAASPTWNVTSWFAQMDGAEVSLDPAQATAALRDALPEAYTDPTPASVTFDGSRYEVAPAVDGSGIDVDSVRAAVQSAFADGSPTATVAAEPQAVPSATTTELATATADSLNAMAKAAGFYVGDERVVPVSAKQFAEWVTVDTDDAGAFAVTADAAGIQKTLDGLAEKVDQDPVSAQVITNQAGTELVTVAAGQDGRVLGETSGLGEDYAAQVAGGNASFALPVDVTAHKTAATTRLAEVDLSEQRIYLRENDKVVDTWLISSGRDGAVTFTGRYSIGWRTPLQDMSGTSRDTGSKYTQPDVPWVMYFNGNQAFHGAYWHNNFGSQMSAGCVNMPPNLAKKLYDWLPNGADVWIHS